MTTAAGKAPPSAPVPGLLDLLDLCFPGLARCAGVAAAFGAPWHDGSRPFVRFEEESGRPISHAGLLHVPATFGGRDMQLGGIHAVCTHPDYRRRGHFRAVLEEAVREGAARYETLVLYATETSLYEPFGFRIVREKLFRHARAHPGGGPGFRRLRGDDPLERGIVERALFARTPVSHVAAVRPERFVFGFWAGIYPMVVAEGIEGVLSLAVRGRTLHLYDIVAPRLPDLGAIVSALAEPIDDVLVYFTPDRLGIEARGETAGPEYDYLMVRGEFPPEGSDFFFPATGRC